MNLSNQHTEKKYWFLLDYKKTKLAIKQKIDIYNADLKALYLKDKELFRKENNLRSNQTEKALTIKSSDETTLFSILEIFGGILHRNSYTKIAPENFRINNKAVCTQKNGHIHKRTSQRHILKLIKAGLITEKIFRGTNTSFELKLNPNLVHFKPNSDWNFLLVELYKAELNNPNTNPKAFSLLYSFTGTLANFPLGYGVASCRLNSTSTILQVHKINIESGIVNYDCPLPFSPPSDNQINNAFLKNFNEDKESQKTCQTNLNAPSSGAPPRPEFWINPDLSPELKKLFESYTEDFKKQDAENEIIKQKVQRAEQQTTTLTTGKTEEDKLWKHVLSFYAFAISILWNNRIISEYERTKICTNIYLQFKKRLGNSQVEPGVFMFRGEFMFRIFLTQKYIKKNIFWNIESPESYFKIEHLAGFNGTIQWVEKSKKMEEQNKVYLSHYKIFIQVWKDYTKNPNVPTYNLSLAQLGKLKKDCWKEYFLQSAANFNQFNKENVIKMWQQHYRA